MQSNKKILISGASTGLGNYLLRKIPGAEHFDRNLLDNYIARRSFYDAIIHCAYDASCPETPDEMFGYLSSNLFLTRSLIDLDCKKFVYISSVDVYPKNETRVFDEFYSFDPTKIVGAHPCMKIFNESMVSIKSPESLILRPSLMIGYAARLNTVTRLCRGDSGPFTLHPDSTFDLVTHEMVAEFLQMALNTELSGIYNVCTGAPISLAKIASHLCISPRWGDYLYQTPVVSNEKISTHTDIFKPDPLRIIDDYRKFSFNHMF